MPCAEPLSPADFAALLEVARGAILSAVGAQHGVTASAVPDHCRERGAAFVTLTQRGALRGCIGSLEAHRALVDDVARNARAAACEDPRFEPLSAGELAYTELEISVLTPPTPLQFADEEEFYARLRAGEHGLVLAHGGRRATFLPAVWQQLPEPRHFVAELRRKAGIAPAVPLMALAIEHYTTVHSPRCALVTA